MFLLVSVRHVGARLRVVPHFSSGDTRRGTACHLFSRGVILTRARVSLALLSLRKNGGLLVVYVGAHPGEHQHGFSIQISISLGKIFLQISRIRNISLTCILASVFVYVPPFISQILDFIYWTVLIFILIYFEWCDTENQQFTLAHSSLILNFIAEGHLWAGNKSAQNLIVGESKVKWNKKLTYFFFCRFTFTKH